jgi:hypothetical protein
MPENGTAIQAPYQRHGNIGDFVDIFNTPREWILALASFCKHNFLLWLRVVGNPAREIGSVDLNSNDSAIPALGFLMFILAVDFVVSMPVLMTTRIAVANRSNLFADILVEFLCVLSAGFLLAVCGKIFWGHGTLGACLIAIFYFSAFNPIADLVADLLVVIPSANLGLIRVKLESSGASGLSLSDVLPFVTTVAVIVSLEAFLFIKAMPVVRLVHGVGTLRATFITLSVGGLNLLAGVFVFMPLLFRVWS